MIERLMCILGDLKLRDIRPMRQDLREGRAGQGLVIDNERAH
jgi:hypothetical protein